MRRWGLAVTMFYAAAVIGLLLPGVFYLAAAHSPSEVLADTFPELWLDWFTWIPILILISAEALLFTLPVDTAWRHARPRRHLMVSIGAAGALSALLTLAAVLSLLAAIYGDDLSEPPLVNVWASEQETLAKLKVLLWWLGLWLLWGTAFYLYLRDRVSSLSGLLSWLLRGSVLELLIVVPCHVWVRQREDCSAPLFTGFGIVSGIAVMLLAFGPGVAFLYQRRLLRYRKA